MRFNVRTIGYSSCITNFLCTEYIFLIISKSITAQGVPNWLIIEDFKLSRLFINGCFLKKFTKVVLQFRFQTAGDVISISSRSSLCWTSLCLIPGGWSAADPGLKVISPCPSYSKVTQP